MYGGSIGGIPPGPPPSNYPASSHMSSSFGQSMYHVSPAGRAPPISGSAATAPSASIVSPSQRVVQLSLSQDQRTKGAPGVYGRMPPISDISRAGGPTTVVSTGIQASAPGGVGLSSFRGAPMHRFSDSSLTAHLSAGSLPSTAGVSGLSLSGNGATSSTTATGIGGSAGISLVSGIPQSRDFGLHSQQMISGLGSATAVTAGTVSSMDRHRRVVQVDEPSDEDMDAAAAPHSTTGATSIGVIPTTNGTRNGRFSDQRPSIFDSMVKESESGSSSIDAVTRRGGGKAQIIKPPMQPLSGVRTGPQSLTTSAPSTIPPPRSGTEIDQGVTEINIDVSGMSTEPQSEDTTTITGSADVSGGLVTTTDQSASSAVGSRGVSGGSAAAVAAGGGATGADRRAESAEAIASKPAEAKKQIKYSERTLRFLGTTVEVRDHETGAFFDAYILDYNFRNKKCWIAYANGWKETKEVDLKDIRSRYRWDKLNLAEWIPQIDDKVECLAQADAKEPFGYWRATIKSIDRARQMYRVSFDGWDSSDNQSVPKNMLRPLKGPLIRTKKLVFLDESEESIKLVNSVKDDKPIISIVDGVISKKRKGGSKSKLEAAVNGSGKISLLSEDEMYESYYPRMWDWIGSDLIELRRRLGRDQTVVVNSLMSAPECANLIIMEIERLRKKYQNRLSMLKHSNFPPSSLSDDGSDELAEMNRGDLLHIGYWPPISKMSGSGLSMRRSKNEGRFVIVCSHPSIIEEIKCSLKYLLQVTQRMYTRIAVDEELFSQEREYQSVLNRLKECKKVKLDFLMKYYRFYTKDKLETVKKHFKEGEIVEICVSTPSNSNGGSGGVGSPRTTMKGSPSRGGYQFSQLSPESEERGQCVIFGTSDKVCREARELLDLTELYIEIPKTLVAEFVGKGGLNVRMLEDHTRVIHIQSFDRHCRVLGLRRNGNDPSSSSKPSASDAQLKQAVADLGDPVMRAEDSAPVLSRRGRKGPTSSSSSVTTGGPLSSAMMDSAVSRSGIETETYVIFGPKKFVSIAAEMVKVELDTCQRRRELQDKFYSLDRELYESNTAQNGSMVRTFYYDEFAGGMSQRQKEEQRLREAAAPVMSGKLRSARSGAASAAAAAAAAVVSGSSPSSDVLTGGGTGDGSGGGGGSGPSTTTAKYVRKGADPSSISTSSSLSTRLGTSVDQTIEST